MCFSDVMFPLLARMRHGLYYNTYIVSETPLVASVSPASMDELAASEVKVKALLPDLSSPAWIVSFQDTCRCGQGSLPHRSLVAMVPV